MLKKYVINDKNLKQQIRLIQTDWLVDDNKVFHLTSELSKPDELRQFYENFISEIGALENYAEDAAVLDRSKQRTGGAWMEVRYDPKFTDAYRHSSNAQPLHTDGSYIPDYPQTLLYCLSNSAPGGETIFVNPADIINYLNNTDPSLLQNIESIEIPHERSGEYRRDYILKRNENLKVNWNYFCLSPNLTDSQKFTAKRFFDFLELVAGKQTSVPVLEVKLKVGEAVFWKDDEVLHGRNSFNPSYESERFIWKCGFRVA